MRHYDAGDWGVAFIFELSGSVIPRALAWALPAGFCAVAINLAAHTMSGLEKVLLQSEDINTNQVWQGFNFLLAFLLTFRTSQAYARWWEGGTLLQQARGEWFNAYSSLIAFSSTKKELKSELSRFHHLLATLMSLLYCSCLQSVSQQLGMNFEVLVCAELSPETMAHLRDSPDKVETLVLWIQRLVIENMEQGVIPVAPPLLAMVFQELSRGVVNFHNVRKISEFLFPFPYAQLATVMLLVHVMVTPIVTGLLLKSPVWAFFTCFISVFALWSLNYVAAEIENPFGDDDNDLPLQAMQRYMNRTLKSLLLKPLKLAPSSIAPENETNGSTRRSIRITNCQTSTAVSTMDLFSTEQVGRVYDPRCSATTLGSSWSGNDNPSPEMDHMETLQEGGSTEFDSEFIDFEAGDEQVAVKIDSDSFHGRASFTSVNSFGVGPCNSFGLQSCSSLNQFSGMSSEAIQQALRIASGEKPAVDARGNLPVVRRSNSSDSRISGQSSFKPFRPSAGLQAYASQENGREGASTLPDDGLRPGGASSGQTLTAPDAQDEQRHERTGSAASSSRDSSKDGAAEASFGSTSGGPTRRWHGQEEGAEKATSTAGREGSVPHRAPHDGSSPLRCVRPTEPHHGTAEHHGLESAI